jgi:hypothetical protein
MGRAASSRTKALQASAQAQQRHRIRTAAFISAAAGAATVAQYLIPHLIKTPMYNSLFTGEAWLQEILNGHPGRFYDSLGLSKHAFQKLVRELQIYAGLKSSRHVTKEEQVAIFLRLCRTGSVSRDLQEHFQRSPDTISK